MIKKIIIENFKSIKYLDINLNPGVTIITGMNNSGKTNLMEAINVLVNDEYYPYKVSESFYFSEDEKEAELFRISAVVNVDNLDNWLKNSNNSKVGARDGVSDYSRWFTKQEIADLLKNRDFIVSKTLERDNPKQYKELISFTYESTNGEKIQYEFDGYSFLSMVYPGAGLGTDKSAKTSLLTYKSSWFGKLIDRVIDDEIKGRISLINKEIINKEEFKKLEQDITEGFFGTEQNLIPSILGIKGSSISYLPSNRNLRTSFDVKIDDGKEEKIENKSTGTQFVTVIELFLNYIGKFEKNGVLSIDEIESTLHPSIAKKVVSIASKKVKQLIFTTHSKELLKIVPFANIIKVIKKGNSTEAKVLSNNQKKLYPLIYSWPEVFFNDGLIVCEGKECALIEAFIASNITFSKQAAYLNLEVINGTGNAVSQFLDHATLIDKELKCSFIYDAEYLVNEANYKMVIKMMKFNGATEQDMNFLENLQTFEQKQKFVENFNIFIMTKRDAGGKGGVEFYYLKDFPPQDEKEKPLFLATEVLQGKSIDLLFDSQEYLETIGKILLIPSK